VISIGIYLTERGYVPEFVLRWFIRKFSLSRLVEADSEKRKELVIKALKTGPIAENTIDANDQHYEVPANYFKSVLGPSLKYSCCWFDNNESTLEEAEIKMMELYIKRAKIEDGQTILDLGCGWGSLTLFLAERFPNSVIYSVSNSNDQIKFIQEKSKNLGFSHVHASVQDVNSLDLPTMFDRVISIEMFEHIRNYKLLLKKIKNILKPDGSLFVHIFCHKTATYLYEEKGEKDWMTRNFFRGGIMPSEDIFSYFEEFNIKKTWMINGTQYTRTLNEWLRIHDESKINILKTFKKHYDSPLIHFHRWRLFYIACSEFFSINNGKEWYVSHYLLSPKNNAD
jgi:cyclopropane-fatty-acyl-phospholipid synthase